MGMAASQARYLSLSARKTNTEYEGQQLNQQRLNLANQSADLFNQMLTMSVPTCPDSNDFTTLQYSWSDGINDEVITDYYQIAVPNENYNYVVTSMHYENVYTGQSKRMNSPEIQASKTNNFSDNPDKTYEVRQTAYHKESLPGAGDDSYTIVVTRNGVESTHEFKRVNSSIDSVEELDAITKRTTKAIAGDKATYTKGSREGSGGSVVIKPATWEFDENYSITVRVPNADYDSTKQMSSDPDNYNLPYLYVDGVVPTGTKFEEINFDDENQREQISQLLATYGDKYNPENKYFATQVYAAVLADGTDADGNAIKLRQGVAKVEETVESTETDPTEHVTLIKGTCTDPTDPTQTIDAYLDPTTGKYYSDTGRTTEIEPDDFEANVTETTAYEYNGKYYDDTDLATANEVTDPVTLDKGDALLDNAGNPIYAFLSGDEMDAAIGSQGEISKVEMRAGDKTAYYTDGTFVISGEELAAIDLSNVDEAAWLDDIVFHSVDNDPLYSNFKAVGNMKLDAVSLDSYNNNEDMQIEIQQIIKDMKANGNDVAYGNLEACFDSSTGEYLGGIYSFKMYGHTYYTTNPDLETAAKGAYEEDAIATNGIDSQNKLVYYTSTYLSTKIEDTKKALMETDGKGRFTSVRFEDDDTVYTLKCETITDEDAYNNAMNAYFYKQEQYDKAIADINAKTEIIQAEDRELQIRLEQLGTEQTALQTEMEACQKVVQKNIESSFKTFGG